MLADDHILDIKDSICRVGRVLGFCSISDETFIRSERDVRWRYPVAHIVCENLDVNLEMHQENVPLRVRP